MCHDSRGFWERQRFLCRISNSKMQDILLCLCPFFFVCGPFIFLFLLCLLSLPSASSLSDFVVVPSSLVLSAPSLCVISPSQALGSLFSISQRHQVNSHAFDRCFPPSFAHMLRPKLGGKCEEIRQSRDNKCDVRAASWDMVRKMA